MLNPFKAGEEVVYIGSKSKVCTPGKTYLILDIDSDGWLRHISDDGQNNGYRWDLYEKKREKIVNNFEIY